MWAQKDQSCTNLSGVSSFLLLSSRAARSDLEYADRPSRKSVESRPRAAWGTQLWTLEQKDPFSALRLSEGRCGTGTCLRESGGSSWLFYSLSFLFSDALVVTHSWQSVILRKRFHFHWGSLSTSWQARSLGANALFEMVCWGCCEGFRQWRCWRTCLC